MKRQRKKGREKERERGKEGERFWYRCGIKFCLCIAVDDDELVSLRQRMLATTLPLLSPSREGQSAAHGCPVDVLGEAGRRMGRSQHEESMIESRESRADKEMETTALNDSKATLESSITDNKSEFLSVQSYAAEEKNSQEQYEEFTIESSGSRADMVKKTTALNDDSKGTLESSITQYEEFMTESSESRADKETTALNDDSKGTLESSIHTVRGVYD